MVDIDRRAMFGVAGLTAAGLGLNTLSAIPAAAGITAIKDTNGVDLQFGIDPTSPLPLSPSFLPKHICVVMISMSSRISHSVARYAFPSTIGEARGAGIAGEIIRHHIATGAFPKNVSTGFMNQPVTDLNDFGFCTQYRIYFYLTGRNIEFGNTNNNSIRFTRLGYEEQSAAANDTFFEAKLINIAGLPKMVQYMSNVHIGPDGQALTTDSVAQRYSMNIVTLLQATSGAPVPIIIDPWLENPRPPSADKPA
jgi:hypothetical protein